MFIEQSRRVCFGSYFRKRQRKHLEQQEEGATHAAVSGADVASHNTDFIKIEVQDYDQEKVPGWQYRI